VENFIGGCRSRNSIEGGINRLIVSRSVVRIGALGGGVPVFFIRPLSLEGIQKAGNRDVRQDIGTSSLRWDPTVRSIVGSLFLIVGWRLPVDRTVWSREVSRNVLHSGGDAAG
jgi:hypothetical protein